MKEFCKNILKRIGIYHPLQSWYRDTLFSIHRNKNRRKYQRYAGSGFTCNVCQAKYSRFVPDQPSDVNREALEKNNVIAGYGEGVYCPNCMSTARERLVIAILADQHSIKGKKILHLSPEKNVYQFISGKANVTTADLLPGFYKTIDGMVQKQDATKFSYASENFDYVIGNHILEHIPNDRQAMKEIFRVLVPGGQAILQVPFSKNNMQTIEEPGIHDPARQSALFGQKDHVRIYALADYVRRLKKVGFDVTVIPYEDLQVYYSYAIQNDECFFNIRKPD